MRFINMIRGQHENMALVCDPQTVVPDKIESLNVKNIRAIVDPRYDRSEYWASMGKASFRNSTIVLARYTENPQSVVQMVTGGFPTHTYPDAQALFGADLPYVTYVPSLMVGNRSTVAGTDLRLSRFIIDSVVSPRNREVRTGNKMWQIDFPDMVSSRQYGSSYPYTNFGSSATPGLELIDITAVGTSSQTNIVCSTVLEFAAGTFFADPNTFFPPLSIAQTIKAEPIYVQCAIRTDSLPLHPVPATFKVLSVAGGQVHELDHDLEKENQRTYIRVHAPLTGVRQTFM